jgi:hypothetical protein
MLAEALMALAATGGNAVVTAMATDTWEGVRHRIAKLFGRGDKGETDAALEKLEQSRTALNAAPAGPEQDRARMQQEIVWQTRLTDLLERHPDAEHELRGIVSEIQAASVSAGEVRQTVIAHDQAQVAVQGHGTQTNTFGGSGGQR